VSTTVPVAADAADRFTALFTAVYREYAPLVRRTALAALNDADRHLAEDLMQETFLRVYRQRTALGEIRSLGGFLKVATRRAVWDHYKVKRNTMERPVDVGHWSFANRSMASSGGYFTPAATGFRTARIGGAR
jgi:DNA-directed RNA polymerase specialized sigma24 family protein